MKLIFWAEYISTEVTSCEKLLTFLKISIIVCHINQTVDAEIKIVKGPTESFRC